MWYIRGHTDSCRGCGKDEYGKKKTRTKSRLFTERKDKKALSFLFPVCIFVLSNSGWIKQVTSFSFLFFSSLFFSFHLFFPFLFQRGIVFSFLKIFPFLSLLRSLGQGFFLNFFYIKKNLPIFFPHKKKIQKFNTFPRKKPEKKKTPFQNSPNFFPRNMRNPYSQ